MSELTSVTISVRGEAEQVVAPDAASVQCAIRQVASEKAEALRLAGAAQQALVGELSALGGVPLRPETEKVALGWLAYSARTEPEFDFDERTGRHGPTGNVVATVSIVIQVRDFARLADLDAALARHEALHVHFVGWQVDVDNPAWAGVRAAAISAAIARGRDYAAALGGSLTGVEQIADAGLLGGRESSGGHAMALARRSADALDDSGTPSLDPVPQTLSAVIEARFTAIVAALS